jgi:hypothetical protein
MHITIHLRFLRNQEHMALYIRYHIGLHGAFDLKIALNLANVHKYERPDRLCSKTFGFSDEERRDTYLLAYSTEQSPS